MPWLIVGLVVGALYLWDRSAKSAGASVQQLYTGNSLSVGPGSAPLVQARINDTLSLTGISASLVTVSATPGMLTPITADGIGPAAGTGTAADWGVVGLGTATFAYPGGSNTVVSTL
jgi:hypothetical protein